MNLEKLTDQMGLGHMLEEPVRVTGGLLHKVYHVTTTAGEYAVKVLNPEIMKRPKALTKEHSRVTGMPCSAEVIWEC